MAEEESSAPLPPAGWYPDPANPETTQRYWDGTAWGDAYAPIGTPIVDPHDPPRPLDGLAGLAIGGLVVVALLHALNIAADARYVDFLSDLIAGTPPDSGEVDDARDLADVSSVVSSLGYALGALAFLPWFYRGYANLRRLGLRNLRYSAGWAVGSWLIPIFNLFRPKQIANDLQRATAGGELHSVGRIDTHPVSPLLHWWWAVYLLTGAMGFVAGSFLGDDPFAEGSAAFDTLEDERAYYIADLVGSGVGIVAAVLAVLVVRRITSEQEAATRRHGSAPLPLA